MSRQRAHHTGRRHARTPHKERPPRGIAPAAFTPLEDVTTGPTPGVFMFEDGADALDGVLDVGSAGPTSGNGDFGLRHEVPALPAPRAERREAEPYAPPATSPKPAALPDRAPAPFGLASAPPEREPSIGRDPVAVAFDGGRSACTAAQLRRFIKSRVYVPMHELRRRFGLDGGEDDVAPVDVPGARIYVGLPSREAALLGELLRTGDIGYELSLDPVTPIVVGVYPMRPVARG